MKKYRVTTELNGNIARQEGWTMWSLMFVSGVIIFFTYIGFQLVPLYSTNSNIKNAMQLALNDVTPSQVSRSGIVKKMQNQLYLDGSHKLLNYKKDLNIKRSQRELIVKVNYERRVPLFFNLSIVASFENEAKRNL